MLVGIDLTEAEFDLRNLTISIHIKSDFPDDLLFKQYSDKTNPTEKGYWMQIVSGYEKYFTIGEIVDAVPYVPYIEPEEETYEI